MLAMKHSPETLTSLPKDAGAYAWEDDFSLASKRYGLEEIKRDATGGIVFTL